MREYPDNILTGAAMSTYELVKGALPEVPEPILGQRFGLMWEIVIHALTDRERFSETESQRPATESDLFINNLIDFVSGGLSTAISTTTAATLTDRAK